MKRLVFSAILGLITIGPISAQKMNIGANLAGGLPLGDLGNGTNFGIGGDVSLDYYFNDRFDLGLEAGYKTFPYSNTALDGEAINIIPIQLTAGFHNDIDDWIDLYGELGGGIFISSSTLANSESYTDAGISPRIGVAFELTPLFFLDVNVNYTHVFSEETETINGVDAQVFPTMNWVGLNVGILYTIGEF